MIFDKWMTHSQTPCSDPREETGICFLKGIFPFDNLNSSYVDSEVNWRPGNLLGEQRQKNGVREDERTDHVSVRYGRPKMAFGLEEELLARKGRLSQE